VGVLDGTTADFTPDVPDSAGASRGSRFPPSPPARMATPGGHRHRPAPRGGTTSPLRSARRMTAVLTPHDRFSLVPRPVPQMATHKVTDKLAFDMLRIASQNTNRKLRHVAADVIERGTLDVVPPLREASRSSASGRLSRTGSGLRLSMPTVGK
jgi:hypothetical protein